MSSFDTFNEVENTLLRAYNRAVMATNLNVDEGKECATRYLSMFSDKENAAIYALLAGMDKYGAETIKKNVMLRIEAKGV
jgi:hypothetical protein